MTREEAIAYGERVIELGLNDETQAFCKLAISALEKNESAEEWYKLLCEKWDSAENKGEWIPVSEKNPGIGEHVLVCLKDGYIDTDDYYSYGFDDWKHLVVAWQPLPEPYKGVSE